MAREKPGKALEIWANMGDPKEDNRVDRLVAETKDTVLDMRQGRTQVVRRWASRSADPSAVEGKIDVMNYV